MEEGRTNAEIASLLGVTTNTVKTQLQRARRKLDLSEAADAH